MAFSQAFTSNPTRRQQEGQRALILRLLARQVGNLSEETRSQINTLSIEQLEALADALLDFSTVTDLETWLLNHG